MKTKNTDITFVTLPPAFLSIPSAPFSVLKSYLKRFGINSNIIYINHQIEQNIDFFSEDWTTNTESLIPFFSFLNKSDNSKSRYIETYYKCMFPDLFLTERSYNKDILKDFENKYYSLIQLIIDNVKINNSKVIGFSSKFLQWIPAIVFSEIIKKILPDIKIIIGGWTNSQAAVDFMKLNKVIDFCIWGEGEIPLKKLMFSIINNNDKKTLSKIPRIVFREDDKIIKTNAGDVASYVNFENNDVIPDFSDFFESADKLKLKNILLPIERGRGCNWNRCKFCYLAQGYKFRVKDTQILLKEIRQIISETNYFKFFFYG